MAIGATKYVNIIVGTSPVVIGGSAQADWIVANSNAGTTNSAAELLYPASVTNSNVFPVEFKTPGPLRVLVRSRVTAGTTTFTTQPVVRLLATDSAGVPERLDATAATNAGVTLTIGSTSAARDASYFYSSPVEAGYDLRGNKTLYVLIETAGAYATGTTTQTAEILIKPLAP